MKSRPVDCSRMRSLVEGLAEVTVSRPEEKLWYISRIIIPKKSRGQGIARELLQELIDLQEEHQSIIYIGVDDCYGGLDVCRFVKSLCKLGFTEIWQSNGAEFRLVRFPRTRGKEIVLANLDPHSNLARRIVCSQDNIRDVKYNPEILKLIDIDAIRLATKDFEKMLFQGNKVAP